MKRGLVIAYGNSLRGDDGVGWEVARRLEAAVEADGNVSIVATQQLTPELAEVLHRVDQVFFVDASVEGEPGSWKCEQVKAEEIRPGALGHHFDAAALLAYTQALFGTRPEAQVITVTAKSFDLGEELSAEVQAALPAVVEHLHQKLA